jgi:predicted aldo/keto reductase-like oxidoreductase
MDKLQREAIRTAKRHGLAVMAVEPTGGTHKKMVTDKGDVILSSSPRCQEQEMRRIRSACRRLVDA